MCKCTPAIKTPFCGKADCQWPKPEGAKSLREQIEDIVVPVHYDMKTHRNFRPKAVTFLFPMLIVDQLLKLIEKLVLKGERRRIIETIRSEEESKYNQKLVGIYQDILVNNHITADEFKKIYLNNG